MPIADWPNHTSIKSLALWKQSEYIQGDIKIWFSLKAGKYWMFSKKKRFPWYNMHISMFSYDGNLNVFLWWKVISLCPCEKMHYYLIVFVDWNYNYQVKDSNTHNNYKEYCMWWKCVYLEYLFYHSKKATKQEIILSMFVEIVCVRSMLKWQDKAIISVWRPYISHLLEYYL